MCDLVLGTFRHAFSVENPEPGALPPMEEILYTLRR